MCEHRFGSDTEEDIQGHNIIIYYTLNTTVTDDLSSVYLLYV